MRKFETKVQQLKYEVLREVAREAFKGNLVENVFDIPKKIIPGKKPSMRCCVYKERAILQERVKLAMGGNHRSKGIIEVIDIACDECPIGGYEVTNTCRGCLTQRCKDACHQDAIGFDENHQAHIDKSKCLNCGLCAKACPYTAIINRKRPCENACPVHAISASENQTASIISEKCLNCGSCISQCPFGAIMDKSFMLDAIDLLLKSRTHEQYRVYAILAPAIVHSFEYVSLYQLVTALKQLGFHQVCETAAGADLVGYAEAEELAEKGFLMSSCCPAFVDYVQKNFPQMVPYLSQCPSPMAALARQIKEQDEKAKVVFIGPCTAKKNEKCLAGVDEYVDVVLTFEEIVALFDAQNIDPQQLEETPLDREASRYGRLFARSGGVSEAIREGLKEIGSTLEFRSEVCSGIEACRAALLKKSKNLLNANYIEGMGCVSGCINGGGVLLKYDLHKERIDAFAEKSRLSTISESVAELKNEHLNDVHSE